jgi:cytidine deaminase
VAKRKDGAARDARTEKIDAEYDDAAAPIAPRPAPPPPPHAGPRAEAPAVDAGAEALLGLARAARERAYAPYSRFKVGAAVATDAGVFVGANVENASYPLSVCAERTAIATAVAAGARRLLAIAVVADTPGPVAPCGGCRQVIREFGPSARVHLANTRGALRTTTIDALLPAAFGPEDLGVKP